MNERIVKITAANWRRTWEQLRVSSGGQFESACVWGGKRDEREALVQKVYFLDELPNVRRHRLFHRTSREATSMLFEQLRQDGNTIIADVHTHPADWVELSATDEAHPIEYRVGLLALVIPCFATGEMEINRVGVHEYLGREQWKQLSAREARGRVQIQL